MISVNFNVEELREIIREEVERGVKNQTLSNFPPILTRQDLGEIFQASESVITKLINIPTFPKFTHIKGRYPRDQVLEWIEQNIEQIEIKNNRLRAI